MQDPRQFVPPSGQAFTTLRQAQAGPHKNTITVEDDLRVFSITTEPKVLESLSVALHDGRD